MSEVPIRIETGTLRFGDDWPAVVLRGDDAFGYSLALEQALKMLKDTSASIMVAELESLLELLQASRVTKGHEPKKVQVLKSFFGCLPDAVATGDRLEDLGSYQ